MPRRRIKSQASENPTSREFSSLGGRHEDKEPEDLGRRKKDPPLTGAWRLIFPPPGDSVRVSPKIQDFPLRHRNNNPRRLKSLQNPGATASLLLSAESTGLSGPGRRAVLLGRAFLQTVRCMVHCPGLVDSVSLWAPSDICSYRGQLRAWSGTGAASGRSGTRSGQC